MKQNEVEDDNLLQEAELATALRALPLPSTPQNLQQRVRGRIGANLFRQRSSAALRAAFVFLALAFIGQLWLNSSPQVSRGGDLSTAELDALFAPPPVESFTVLDRQQKFAYRTLQRWEFSQ